MLIVIPRSFSSGALSIESNARNSPCPRIAQYFVIAAVSVVFPWSMCPIVPTFMCGFVRSNLCLAINALLRKNQVGRVTHNQKSGNDLFGHALGDPSIVVKFHGKSASHDRLQQDRRSEEHT